MGNNNNNNIIKGHKMATPITKTSGIDNWYSDIPGTVEVWYRGHKVYVEHKTARILNISGETIDLVYTKIPKGSQALKMAIAIALDYK